MKAFVPAIVLGLALQAQTPNPTTTVWRINPQPGPAALEVHSVTVEPTVVRVRSAGLALQSLSPLDTNALESPKGIRRLEYVFPLTPRPANAPSETWGILGAFVNGVPIYGAASDTSWRGQNIWHQDAIRANPTTSPLVAQLLERTGRHSPLIGFALDGYPIYGPWGWDDQGAVRRFRSSYRLRDITRRDQLPKGIQLGPSQEGPPVDSKFPLGTFIEDYEFAPGVGDLDLHNGRTAKTPEYPNGTYAYFVSTDMRGSLAYPYLVGRSFYGHVDSPDFHGKPPTDGDPSIQLMTSGSTLTFAIQDAQGRRVRLLERVHEKPIHLVIVSQDLEDFAHIHPELQPDGTFAVDHIFPHGGRYTFFADFTMPGKPQSISRFAMDVPGPPATHRTSQPETIHVAMRPPARLRTGEDLTFQFDLAETDLDPYLGAWAHMMIVSEDGKRFIHAHPADEGPPVDDSSTHSHTAPGPSPSTIRTTIGFTQPGRYRLWFQAQRDGVVSTTPFTLDVGKGSPATQSTVPSDAIRVRVSRSGFEPSRIAVPANKPIRLAFDRKDAENCANAVVFPDAGIRRELPAGKVTVIDLPARPSGEIAFACGMRMYRGTVVVR